MKFNRICAFMILLLMSLMTASGCGSKGGMGGDDDGGGGGDGGETPPEPTYNFTGTVYGENGSLITNANIYAIKDASSLNPTITNAEGQFALNLSSSLYTVLGSRSGYINQFRLVDITTDQGSEQILILREGNAPAIPILAGNDDDIIVTSNAPQGANPAQLIFPEGSGQFQVGKNTGLTSVNVRLEYIDVTEPLPLPMPSPGTLAEEDTVMPGKQTPSVLFSIDPPLLKMVTPATLTLPNPDSLTNQHILWFDPYAHQWRSVGTTDDTPGDGTSFQITNGGFYGIFFEQRRLATIQGNAAPLSLIYVGDEIIKVPSNGQFSIDEIPVPSPDNAVNIINVNPDGETFSQKVVLTIDQVTEVNLAPPPPGPTYNFTGTVYGENGSLITNANIYAIKDASNLNPTSTNAEGQFALSLARSLFTVLGSRSGYINQFRLVDMTHAESLEQIMILQDAKAPVIPILAGSDDAINVISNINAGANSASLTFPAGSGVFQVGTNTGLTNVNIRLEYIDIQDPLPVPMPSPGTLAAEDVIMAGKQAPSVLVSIDPPLLKLETPATLTLPNPDSMTNRRVLWFDPYAHQWRSVGTTDDTPGDGTSLQITNGGFYGIFFEQRRLATIQGNAAPLSLIYVGDKIIEVPSNGQFYIDEIPVPSPDNVVNIININPDGETFSQKVVLTIDKVTAVDLTPPPPGPTYNFTGTVYGDNGSPITQVNVYGIRDAASLNPTVTNSQGQFSLNLTNALHTVLGSRPGYINLFRLVDLSSAEAVEQTLILQAASAPVIPVLAGNNEVISVLSNIIQRGELDNRNTAQLDVPAGSGTFQVGSQSGRTSVNISVEYLKIDEPLPVPLPSTDTLAAEDVILGGRQAPSVLVSIDPALLKMTTPANLILPNPDGLAGVRILWFNPYKHLWEKVGTTDETPADGTPVEIRNGGVYGIFFEDMRLGTVRGKAAPGSYVYVGDQIVKVPPDGNFFIDSVPVPPEGQVVVMGLDPDSGVIFQNATLAVGGTTIVDLSQVEIGSVDLKSDSEVLFSDGESKAVLTAEVFDSDGKPVRDGTQVTFTTTAGALTLPGGMNSNLKTLSTTTENGVALAHLISSTSVGTATVNSEAGGASDSLVIQFVLVPSSFSLSLSQTSVPTDNSESATIMATVLDNNSVPIEGVVVRFTIARDPGQESGGGQLSASTATTDENGQAQVEFSSGTVEKRNQVVTVTATINDELQKSIPIQIRGTTVTIETEKTGLVIGGAEEDKSLTTISVKDAGDLPIFDAVVTFDERPENSLDNDPAPGFEKFESIVDGERQVYYKTNVEGKLQVYVKGAIAAEEAVLIAQSLGAMDEQVYTVSSMANAFRIDSLEILPEQGDPQAIDPESLEDNRLAINTNDKLRIRVHIPDPAKQSPAIFSTTFGKWDENQKQVLMVPATDEGKASAVLYSDIAGIATMQVWDGAYKNFDLLTIAISAPSSEASQISLQASSTLVAPNFSGSDAVNQVELTAVVKNENDQVVGGAPVAFSLENTTGGGEKVSPVLVLTNSSGIATTTFTSGTLSSGSEGVRIIASLVGKPDTDQYRDDIRIVIGGTAASVIIGQSTKIESINSDTAYELTMSVLVADSNGNPVKNAEVTLSTWANRYATGFWGPCVNGSGCCIGRNDILPNEDQNQNLIMDPGEDKNGDGKLTPPSTAAGAIRPGTVMTTENGVAEFQLVYVKESAGWIEDRITASTRVLGSETQSTYTFWLPWSGQDSQDCVLPHSPYNQTKPPASLSVNASPDRLTADGTDTSVITAIVLDENGDIVNDDTAVQFRIIPPNESNNWGGFPSATNTTAYTTGGIATVIYRAGNIATTDGNPVVIEATTGDQTERVSIILSKGNLTLSATEYTLIADGTSTSVITAEITDVNGEPIQGTAQVTFTLSSLDSATGVFTENGQTEYTVFAQGGTASATFKSGKVQGTISVKAETVEGLVKEIQIRLLEEQVGNIIVSADPSSIPADGITSTQIRAEIRNNQGNPISQGTEVVFTVTPRDIGAAFPNGGATYITTTPNEDGVIVVPLISSQTPGDVEVAVTADEISATVAVEFRGRPVGKAFTISAEQLNMTLGDTNTITVRANDALGKPVPDNTSIRFRTYNTGGVMTPNVTTTEDGEAESILSPGSTLSANGLISVTAETTGGPTTHITSFSTAPEDPNAMDNYIVFAGTDGGGIYKSTDSGKTWMNMSRSFEIPGQNWIDPYVNDVAVDFDDPNVVYAATGFSGKGNVYRSLDGGLNWNSNDLYQWNGVLSLGVPVTRVIADGYVDDIPSTASSWVWIGTSGEGVYYSMDGETFFQSQGLGSGRIVHDMAMVEDAEKHGPDAVLYAGTSNGAYKSADGGRTWARTPTSFTGDTINTLAIYPDRDEISVSDIIYAGTEDAGVWMSTDSGASWIAFSSEGMTERNIKDLLVDPVNQILYASTYKKDPLKPTNVGSIYAHELSIDGTIGEGRWFRVNDGIQGYHPNLADPELDTVAFHAIAPLHGRLGDITAILIGGEGISVYRTKEDDPNTSEDERGIETGNPQWVSSKTGINNTIMARIPIVVRDPSTMEMRFADDPPGYFQQNSNEVTFELRIEDENGNPPGAGANLTVTKNGGQYINIDFTDTREHPLYPVWGGYPYKITVPIATPDNKTDEIWQFQFTPADDSGVIQVRGFVF